MVCSLICSLIIFAISNLMIFLYVFQAHHISRTCESVTKDEYLETAQGWKGNLLDLSKLLTFLSVNLPKLNYCIFKSTISKWWKETVRFLAVDGLQVELHPLSRVFQSDDCVHKGKACYGVMSKLVAWLFSMYFIVESLVVFSFMGVQGVSKWVQTVKIHLTLNFDSLNINDDNEYKLFNWCLANETFMTMVISLI